MTNTSNSRDENLYAVITGSAQAPTIHYIGTTARDVHQRFAEHVKGANDPLNSKELYEAMRVHGIENFSVLPLGSTADGLHESDFVKAAILEGHPLTNSNMGNNKVSKPKDFTFRDQNREADKRIDLAELAKSSSDRRNRLHAPSQNLTKPEIVRQRVLGHIPTAEEWNELKWMPSEVLLMPWRKLPKNTDDITTESCRYGDYLVILAFRKGQWASYVKNSTKAEATSYNTSWSRARPGFTRLDALRAITAEWPKAHWWPLSQAHRD